MSMKCHIIWPLGTHLSPSSWLTAAATPVPWTLRPTVISNPLHWLFPVCTSHFLPYLGRFLPSFSSFLQSYLLNAAFLYFSFPLHWHFITLFSFLLRTCYIRFFPSVYCCLRSTENNAWYRKDAP